MLALRGPEPVELASRFSVDFEDCRPHYSPREFSTVFSVVVSLPSQTDAGTKAALTELYSVISKTENAHPEAALLVAGDFNAGKLKSVLHHFYHHVTCATRGIKTLDHLYSAHRDTYQAPPPSFCQIGP
jgi:hypothetical protein